MSAASTSLLDFYRWGFPGAPLQVHLSLEVVNGIRRQIQETGNSPSSLSQCGLLLGISQPGITRILNFEPLPLLDADSLESALLKPAGEAVGFYRTTPVGSRAMTDEDRRLAAKFPQPNSVFLLIETIKSGIGDAHFCFWGEGELFDYPVALFPFDPEALAPRDSHPQPGIVRKITQGLRAAPTPVVQPPEQRPAASTELAPRPSAPLAEPQSLPVPTSAPVPMPPAEQRQRPAAPAPVPPQKQTTVRPWLTWVLLAAVVLLSLALGAFSYFRPGSKLAVAPAVAETPEPPKTTLGLAVEKRGNGLLVSWNGAAPIMAKANFGMLLIRGGDVSRDVPLNTEELRAGGFVYTLAAEELRFQLNVVAGEQVAREFLTVVRSQMAELPDSQKTAAAFRTPVGTQTGSVILRKAPVKPFNPGPATPDSSTVSANRIEDAPAVGRAVSPANPAVIPLLNQPAVAAPAPLATHRAESPQLTQLVQREPPPSPLSVEAHPPVATHKVIPSLPSLLRGQVWTATVVEVRVSVDEAGRVVKAEALPKIGLNPWLRDEAVKAARNWRFQPAQFNGHPVPADTVVQFNFAASR